MNVKQPSELKTRTAGDVLDGIRTGEWRGLIERVRSLPPESSGQRAAKEGLPFVTWSGSFSYHNNASLIVHSGLIGVDLDHLDSTATKKALHDAVDDHYCAAAFRSARGEGLRLLLRVPPATAPQHGLVFDAAANHVRLRYGIEPDSRRDVCRASFVSYDGGMWLNPQAVVLPVLLPALRKAGVDTATRCVNRASVPIPWWVWLAHEVVPHDFKPDGTALTHFTLVDLGKRLALRIEREGIWRGAENIIEIAAHEWLKESHRRGIRLRGTLAEYSGELRISVLGAKKKSWFRDAADRWTRWAREQGFPKGEAAAAIVFAIRCHCRETGSRKFFLGCRDAGTIAGVSHERASQILNRLCSEKILRRSTGQRPPRHAAEFELLSP